MFIVDSVVPENNHGVSLELLNERALKVVDLTLAQKLNIRKHSSVLKIR